MKVICEYCGNYLDSTEEKCPSCGAPNNHFARTASDSPKTIEQLKEFCRQKNIPLETLHMHIGENYTEPKAFGIYRDPNTGRFIVYKNKPDGSRAIRYEGADEAYAVNEIYMKIKDLILDSRRNSPTSPSPVRSSSGMGERLKRLKWWHWVIIILVLAFLWYMGKNPGRGSSSGHYSSGSYYSYDDSDGSSYGYSSDDWSSYDDDDDDSFFSWGSDDDDDWSSYDDWDSDDDYSWSDSYDFSYDDWDSDW